MSSFKFLVEGLLEVFDFAGGGWGYLVMWAIGGLLIFLAIKKDMEPTLLLPLGFGTILVNLPFSGAVGEYVEAFLPKLTDLSPLCSMRVSQTSFFR